MTTVFDNKSIVVFTQNVTHKYGSCGGECRMIIFDRYDNKGVVDLCLQTLSENKILNTKILRSNNAHSI